MSIALALFGSLIGSFLNVVVYRVPAGLSVVNPPSACPNCGNHIRRRDNVPVFGWLLLRGKCRDCAAPISVRYPLVELGTALAFAVVAVRFVPDIAAATDASGAAASVLQLVAFLYLAAVSIALALIDLDTMRLPNAIVLPSYAVGVVLLGAAAALSGEWGSLLTALAGAVILGGVYLAIVLVAPRGMGMGDVKLAGVLGLFLGWLGWDVLAVGALAAFLLGGLFGVVLLAISRAGRGTAIPFGPWMLLGAWIGILAGPPLASAYLSLFGLEY
ncbi:prepilin peptidase [Herbiconiux sp. SYSU D00978]|uniref:prepilin peptidase n=1 Tax=Herbiconiux sp. SYSU D00978 TaxID=2812562 RepID=UPI0027DDF0FE|nr:prepilin peptidase [Herbiconiux sp. SYSU D00978]